MKTTSALILTISAVASAGVSYNATTGEYLCSRPNARWCAGGSFESDIIIRCNAQGKGQPGRCTNNLAGQPPPGLNQSLCWQSTADAGDAACEKNCVVYADTPFRLPGSVCTPYSNVSGTQSLPIGSPTGSQSRSVSVAMPMTTGTGGAGRGNGTTVRVSSTPAGVVPPRPTLSGTGGRGNGTTVRVSSTPAGLVPPRPTLSGTGGRGNGTTVRVSSTPAGLVPPRPTLSGTGGSGGGRGNGTAPSTTRGGGGGGVAPGNPTTAPGQPGQPGSTPSGTRTPVPPSTPTGPSTVPTAAAARNAVGHLAVVGIVAAYFL